MLYAYYKAKVKYRSVHEPPGPIEMLSSQNVLKNI